MISNIGESGINAQSGQASWRKSWTAKAAAYLGRNLVRTVRQWCPEKKVFPAVFPDEEWRVSFDPLQDGPSLVEEIDSDGLLIDTFNKSIGEGLLDYCTLEMLSEFVDKLHNVSKEATDLGDWCGCCLRA